MELTKENIQYIDSLTNKDLLRKWRFAPVGDPWFQRETGQYWKERMKQQKETADHVHDSKSIGW